MKTIHLLKTIRLLKGTALASLLLSSLASAGTLTTSTDNNTTTSSLPSSLQKAEHSIEYEQSVNYKELIKSEAMKNYNGQMVLVIGNKGARVLALVRTPSKYRPEVN